MIEFNSMITSKIEFPEKNKICILQKNDLFARKVLKESNLSSFDFCQGKTKINIGSLVQIGFELFGVGYFALFVEEQVSNELDLTIFVRNLKMFEVKNTEDSINKINLIVDKIGSSNIVFAFYCSDGEFRISEKEFENIDLKRLFYFDENGSQKAQSKTKNRKKEKENKPISFLARVFNLISEERLHFLLVLITSFSITISIMIGILNIYAGEWPAIPLFIYSALNIGANIYVFFDLLKQKKTTQIMLILSVIIIFIGYSLGLLGHYIYYINLGDKNQKLPSFWFLFAVGGISSFLAILLSSVLPFIFKKN